MSFDEWWDVVEADGAPTGETFLRGTPGWPTGRFHVIVATCVFRVDGMVLLTQRASGKEFAYGWEFPGGSALAGEASRSAASRELRQEAGLRVPTEALILVGRFTEPSALLDFYIAQAPSNVKLRLQTSAVMAAEWATTSDVEDRVEAATMALPWIARLQALWSDAQRAMSAAR